MHTESWHRWISDITLDIPACPTILEAVQEMVQVASFSNARVHADINDIWVCVSPGEIPLEIMARYKQAAKERRLAEKAARKKTHYCRAVLYADKEMEIVRISWPKGSKSRPHDHGDSRGCTIVLKGSIFEKTFDRKNKMFLRDDIHPANIGETFEESPRYIHIVGNANPDEEAVTLHVYMPPLKMNYYDDLA